MAASALILNTAVAMDDHETYDRPTRLVRLISALCTFLGKLPSLAIVGSLGADLLALSMRLASQSQLQTGI